MIRQAPTLIAVLCVVAVTGVAPARALVDVTVSDGTSMSVAVSPDQRTLAVDLQGSMWTLAADGGPATRLTDPFNDARQPAWSHDGTRLAFSSDRGDPIRTPLRAEPAAPPGACLHSAWV